MNKDKNSLTPDEIDDLLAKHCMTQVMLAGKILVTPARLSLYMNGKAGENTKVGKRAFQYFKALGE